MKKILIVVLSLLALTAILRPVKRKITHLNLPPTKYTVSFYSGDELIKSIETAGNEKITLPTVSEKPGYTFGGWYTDKDVWTISFTEDSYLNTPLTQDLSVYAKWTKDAPATYTLTFISDGKTYTTLQKTDGSVLQEDDFPTPDKAGYTFVGWFTDEDFSNSASYPYIVNKNDTFYAKWTKDPDPVYSFSISDGTITGITGTLPESGEMIIPETVNGQTVIAIGSNAFASNKSIKSVNLPSTIKTIGSYAFQSCTKLQSINFPEGLTTIDDSAFTFCMSLDGITFPSTLQSIGDSAFRWCEALTSVTLPDATTRLAAYAFSDCSSLSQVNLNKVESIGMMAFSRCKALTSISLPDTLISMGKATFSYCSKLAYISLPENRALKVEYDIVDGTAYANNSENYENGVLYIGKYLIKTSSDFSTVETYTVKAGTICIANHAMYYNTGKLTTLNLPNGVIRIGTESFASSANLSKITLPESLLYVNENAFEDTAYLNNYIKNKTNSESDGTLYAGPVLLSVHWFTGTEFRVKPGTIVITDSNTENLPIKPFFDSSIAKGITSIILPDSLKAIGNNAFKETGITSVSLPEGIIRIGDSAFSACKSLSSVSPTPNLEELGQYAFSNCQLTTFVLPSSVWYIGVMPFAKNPIETLYCEAESKPSGWQNSWNQTFDATFNTVWGYKG